MKRLIRRLVAVALVCGGQVLTSAPADAAWQGSATAGATIGTGTLTAPTAPAAARSGCVVLLSASVRVSWTASSRASGYVVRYGTTSGGPYGASVTVAGGSATSTEVSGLAHSTTYHAVVVATVGGWTSAPTAQVSVTTPTALCV